MSLKIEKLNLLTSYLTILTRDRLLLGSIGIALVAILACTADHRSGQQGDSDNGRSEQENEAGGTETSGGGGETRKSDTHSIQKFIVALFTFLKTADSEGLKHLLFGPYGEILRVIIENTGYPISDEAFRNPVGLTTDQANVREFYLAAFKINEKETTTDSYSFADSINMEKLREILQRSTFAFAQCPEGKVAYYSVDKGNKGEFCFDIVKLSDLGAANLDAQITSIVMHEIAHAVVLADPIPDHVQDAFFKYYSQIDAEYVPTNKIYSLVEDILLMETSMCLDDESLRVGYTKFRILAGLLSDFRIPPRELVYNSTASARLEHLSYSLYRHQSTLRRAEITHIDTLRKLCKPSRLGVDPPFFETLFKILRNTVAELRLKIS